MTEGDDEETGGSEESEEPTEAAESEETAGAGEGEEPMEEAEPEETADSEEDEEPTEEAEPEEVGDSEEDEEPTEEAASEETGTDLPAETLDDRLDDIEAALEAAETEADLDEVEARLDEIEADVESSRPEETDDDEDAEEEDPFEAVAERIETLRGDLEAARGPYAEDIEALVEDVAGTIEETRWTEDGQQAVIAATETFVAAVGEEIDTDATAGGDTVADHVAAIEGAAASVAEAGLDPDDDKETIETLLAAAEELEAAVEDAEEWDDLSVREQLDAQGLYDRMTSENRKDFPPELTAVRVAEAENDPERILLALENLESEFMQENCIDALRRLGAEEAFDAMHERAQKRKRPPIEVLGKIGDERAVETLTEYANSGNPPLQRVTLRALGEIGSEEATQAVANALEDEQEGVRTHAARALGLIGDTRGIAPLSDVLDGEDSNDVRAAAAWSLVQIGTKDALEAAAEHADDRAYTVQVEAERAEELLAAAAEEPTA